MVAKAMTTATPLPSLEECTAVLSPCIDINASSSSSSSGGGGGGGHDNAVTVNVVEEWRKVIQQCLSHGTNYDHCLHNDDAGGNTNNREGAENKALTLRAEEAGKLLVAALEWYLVRWHQQRNNDNDPMDATTSNDNKSDKQITFDIQKELKDNPILCAVVEALWLVGCLLESSDDDTTGTANAKKKETMSNPKKVPYQCLLVIIRQLTTPRPWLAIAVGGDKSGNETKKEDGMDVDDNNDDLRPVIPITSLQTTLELSLLQSANLLPEPPPTASKPKKAVAATKAGGKPAKPAEPDTSASFLQKKLKKMNTDMYYRQHKFNLLAEESEGYAKLLGYLLVGLKDGDDDDGEDGNKNNNNNNNNNNNEGGKAATKYVRELIGAFDLDPNRVLDLSLDALEWELNEIMVATSKAGGAKSFAELSSKGNNEWWGLEHLRLAMAAAAPSSNSGGDNAKAIRSLVAIVRELDGSETNGLYEGRAVAHLLGFKYRSYHGRAAGIAAAAKAGAGSDNGKSSSSTTASVATPTAAAATSTYPRSLYLSTAFLCAHDVLDPHALLPHLLASKNPPPAASSKAKALPTAAAGVGSTTPATTNNNTTATSLMQAYKTHTADTIKRLKKLGVVSLNSKSENKKDNEKKNETPKGESLFNNDPVVGIFRALLAMMGDWDACAAFLAHASVPDFAMLVKEGAVEKIRDAMDSAALAACALNEGVASDACDWVNGTVDGLYRELYPSSSNGNAGIAKQGKSGTSMVPSGDTTWELTKDSTLEDMSAILKAPLACLAKSGKIRMNQNLYMKLCRLYKHKLTPQQSPSNGDTSASVTIDDDTLSVLSTFLVPSLSLFPSDPALPTELWSTLRNVSYELRYKLYSSWRHPGLEKGTLRLLLPKDTREGKVPKPLDNIESEIQTGISARYVLKRISKENIRDMGRKLAKASHNNPLVVFTDILSKIESYDNLILMMVDTFEFVTDLGRDVLGYCLLVSLGGGEESGNSRSGTKMGGLNTEKWLASLETFTGAFYKKFPSVELRGILVYLTKRFKDGEASELGVLRSLIKTAGGYGFVDYDSTGSLSDLQLDGRCGSRLLKRETSSFGVVDDINRTASRGLRNVLQGGDLGVIILILLSQIRSKFLYSKSSETVKEHVKVIGNMYDDCEAVLCLLLEYLSDSSDDSEAKRKFASSMPSLRDLHEKLGVDTAVAWMLCRPLVRKSMFYMDDRKLIGSSKGGSSSTTEEQPPAYLESFSTSSSEMTASYSTLLPQAAWKHITPTMFEMFYSLSIYDITCPEERYNVDIDRLKKECERLTQLQKGGAAARGQMSVLAAAVVAAGGSHDQIRQAGAFTKTHAMELDRLKRNADQLTKDFQRQQKRNKLVWSKLDSQKGLFMIDGGNNDEKVVGNDKKEDAKNNNNNSNKFAPAFMTYCIYPRFLLSPEDALYCAHFIKLLHTIKVPGFLTIELIDDIVDAVTGSLYCMTEDEAGNCSIFLNEIWKCVNDWRYDNDAFASDLKDTPGSQVSKEFAHQHSIEGDHSLSSGITHDDYKSIYTTWHRKLATSAIGCIQSSEYMHTRCALIVLSRIVLVFPTQPKQGEAILKALGPLMGEENAGRPDIMATSQGYCSQLTKARDDGMWKEENIAVTKARQEREKTKADERKKKLAKQHEEMKKESELIAMQLGASGGGRDGRGGRPDRGRGGRDGDRGGGRPWGMDQRNMHSQVPPLSAGAAKFTPKSGGESRDLHGGRPGPVAGTDSSRVGGGGRTGMDRDAPWERDRGGGGGGGADRGRPSDRPSDGRGGRPVGGERRKRSRSPEPGEDTEGGRGSQAQTKRSRDDWDRGASQQGSRGGSGGGGGGARRSDRRGGGSSRY